MGHVLHWFLRLVRPKRVAAFDQALEELRKRPESQAPITKGQAIHGLRGLAEREPETPDALTKLEAESFILSERIRKSPACNQMPHLVWHFLADADIRFKDSNYGIVQKEGLRECLEEWERDAR